MEGGCRAKVGAETEAKIKTGAGAGELRPLPAPASGCYYTSIMRKGQGGGGLVCAPRHTLD